MGIPPDSIRVIPHATPDPLQHGPFRPASRGGGALYVGRLSREKGVDVLLEAWRDLDIPLRIAGTGPLEAELRAANTNPRVEFLGHLSRDEVRDAFERASFVVMPHRWLEPFGLVAIEAFAHGRPVITSDRGGPADIVEHRVNGVRVVPGDAETLRQAVLSLYEDSDRLTRYSEAARGCYEERYRPPVFLGALRALYGELIGSAQHATATACTPE
jgi:glycosyltransferase involved in cell wall biosynthesis